jgi:hypothetical protein
MKVPASYAGRFAPRTKSRCTHWIGGWVSPKCRSGRFGEDKNTLPVAGLIHILLLLLLLLLLIIFMQGVYNYIPETKHVSRVYNLAHILCLQYIIKSMLFPTILSGAFAKFRRATTSFDMFYLPICPSAWYNSAPARRICVKFDIWEFFENMSRKFTFY